MEAHGILQNALRLNPPKEGDIDPAMLKGDLHHCYLTIGSEGVRSSERQVVETSSKTCVIRAQGILSKSNSL